jgi:DNA-binding PucR family transcriptional regulator
MLGFMEPREEAVAEQLKTVHTALRAVLPELCSSVTASILEKIGSLAEDMSIVELLRASVESNITNIVDVIGYEIDEANIEAPVMALEYARRLAQRGVPVSDLVRAYRVGQAVFMQRSYLVLADHATDLETAFAAGLKLSDVAFGYVDRVSELVIQAYAHERDVWVRSAAALRAATVRGVLDGGPLDVTQLEPALGYRLRQHHVGLIAWVPEPKSEELALVELERTAGRIAERFSSSHRALFVARDESSSFVWLPLGSSPDSWTGISADIVPLLGDQVHLAVGGPATGPEGFRTTMREALRAHTVVLAAGVAAARVVPFAEVAPIALLAREIDIAQSWVLNVLGPLANDDDQAAGLRDTLRLFLSTGGSFLETARRLTVHKNTVAYRVHKAEELRGRPVTEDRLEVELALLACHWLGSTVLTSPH